MYYFYVFFCSRLEMDHLCRYLLSTNLSFLIEEAEHTQAIWAS